jgi:GAF domain-containing protein
MLDSDAEAAPQDCDEDASRLVQLARVTADLTRAADLATISTIVTHHAAQALGADVALIALMDGPHRLRAHGAYGLTRRQADEWAAFDLDQCNPMTEAVRTRSVVRVKNRSELLARFPALDDGTERSSVVVPLLDRGVKGNALGAVAFRFNDRPLDLDSGELASLSVLADVCAQSVLRIESERASIDQQARLQFLADATTILASTMDYRETLAQVAGLAVPFHADWCAVDILEDGVLHTLAVAHVDPAKVALARQLQERWPADPQSPQGAALVARTGRSLLVEEVTEEMLVAGTRDAEHLRLARELALRSAVSVPLRARERVLGTLTLVSAESGRRYCTADVAFVEDLGRRAGLAIDNAELYSETRRVAGELQATLLPQELPRIAGWELAATYRQAGRTEVGGDFYDVTQLPDGRICAIIGDVMGRGVDAAMAGSRLRAAAHVLMTQDPRPAALSSAVDRFMAIDPLTPLATAVYLLVDEHRDTAEMVVAGHPPPLLARAGGVQPLEEGRSPLIGIAPQVRRSVTFDFGPGDLLILYTDGLVERRTEQLDQGVERLAHANRDLLAASGAAPGTSDLALLVQSAVARVSDPERHDDVAVLALRRLVASGDPGDSVV